MTNQRGCAPSTWSIKICCLAVLNKTTRNQKAVEVRTPLALHMWGRKVCYKFFKTLSSGDVIKLAVLTRPYGEKGKSYG